MEAYTTIGIAGHIDHGKTALTKQLTNIDTDRLKEEKERAISIENGFAFIEQNGRSPVAVIDVPGHERFIRQMIAGVAGIDLVLLVIAADEGVMPQTREHAAILRLLGITDMLVVLTKTDKADPEWIGMVKEDIQDFLLETPFCDAPFYEVDSLKGTGVAALKAAILDKAAVMHPRSSSDPFRLPVDSVFALKGIGTIARGTIFNGRASIGDELRLLPAGKKTRIKSIQVHHQESEMAAAGQRAALHLHGIEIEEVKRGDVLVSSEWYQPSSRLDIKFDVLNLQAPFKQRSAITCHIGASAVQGRLIFFDRKKVEGGESLFCQIELDDPVVAVKGDRIIIRRPSPAETIGGGVVIDQKAGRHKSGTATITELQKRFEGSDEDLIKSTLLKGEMLLKEEIAKETGIALETVFQILTEWETQGKAIKTSDEAYVHDLTFNEYKNLILNQMQSFHQIHPLKTGRSKADLLASIKGVEELKGAVFTSLLHDGKIHAEGHLVSIAAFEPSIPAALNGPVKILRENMKQQGLETEAWTDLCQKYQVDECFRYDLKQYFLQFESYVELNDGRLISDESFNRGISALKKGTKASFSVKEAKEILNLSRKYVIPFLEATDREGWTKRTENVREWSK